MSTFNSPLASMPKSFYEELRVEWDAWEKMLDDHILVEVAEASDPDFMQARATVIFWEVIAAHDTTADPNAGIRHGGSRLGRGMKLSCTARLDAIIDAMKSLAIVRCDVIRGEDLRLLIANPRKYATAKISNKLTNGTKRDKYKELHKRKQAEKAVSRAAAREKKQKLKAAAALRREALLGSGNTAALEDVPDESGEESLATGSDGESFIGED